MLVLVIMPICDECGGKTFKEVNDSILKRQYSFVSNLILKMCDKCGAKYVICSKCGSLLTRIHLSLDVYGVRDTCPECKTKDHLIENWIKRYKSEF